MKTLILLAVLAAACGGKSKKSTTPEGGTQTEMKSSGSATGGATYGGTVKPADPDPGK